MAIRYSEALGILRQVAAERVGREDGTDVETLPLEEAVGLIAAEDHLSPAPTPPFDTPAVDGYAISSAATANATKKRPVTFIVKGTINVGDEPRDSPPSSGSGIPSCFEIMAGARFPKSTASGAMDACVKLEDVVPTVFGSQKMITVVEPVSTNTNKKLAGTDIQHGQILVNKEEKIQPRHIMALASAGVTKVVVRRKLRVAIWSTGVEYSRKSSHTESRTIDANLQFLIAALRDLDVTAEFKGVLGGSAEKLSEALSPQINGGAYDIVLAADAVFKREVDLTVGLEAIGARIRFHGIAIQPGRPVLFATLPTAYGEIAFLRLPGDPVATAACFRFLVVPLIKQLSGLRQDVPKILRIQAKNEYQDLSTRCPPQSDCFRHGLVQQDERGEEVVQLSADQGAAKVSPFAASDCWVHIPRGHSGSYRNTLVYCYAHTADKSA